VLSVVRLCCIPVFVWLLFGRDHRAAAGWLLGALGATDWVDGWIARRFHQVSELGKVLDPVADRLLLIVGGVSAIVDGSVPLVVAIIVVTREVLVGGTLLAASLAGMKRFDVQWAGKAGTFCLMFAVPLFIGGHSTLSYDALLTVLAWGFTVPGLVLSWYAAATYVPTMRRALAAGRAERSAR
jgi:cardiolipin synthase